ncbi:MAG: Asp-tRNA(Asn)/Glu-tRNA(Gln) amidotransferase subunit GatC [Candidatus Gracilibacteria bacterium]|nr:Asp-tRNA(Asn)/Glu-tRNA(Gln) amidotransferase subunit GatC [Candidatus Gracilibacteria bacterium]
MSLTQEQIKHIAHLSALKLSPDEIARYQKDLNSIVGYIDMLAKVPESELQRVKGNIVTAGLIPRTDQEFSPISGDELLECSPKKIVNHQISIDNIMS